MEVSEVSIYECFRHNIPKNGKNMMNLNVKML